MCNSSMEERKCTNCKVCKTGEEFNGMNKQCIQCLDKSKEFHKKKSQKEVFCDICLCNVKRCRVPKHLKTNKHIINKKRKRKKKQSKKK